MYMKAPLLVLIQSPYYILSSLCLPFKSQCFILERIYVANRIEVNTVIGLTYNKDKQPYVLILHVISTSNLEFSLGLLT